MLQKLIVLLALSLFVSTVGLQSVYAEHPILNVIANGETHTVTIDETISDLTIEQGGTLIIEPGVTLMIDGYVENNGTIQNNGIISIMGFGYYGESFNETGFPIITQIGCIECGGGSGELINFGLIENNAGAEIQNGNNFSNAIGGIIENNGIISHDGGEFPASFGGFGFPPITETGGGFFFNSNHWLIHNRAGGQIIINNFASFENLRVINNEGTIDAQNGFFGNFQGTIFSCTGDELGTINGGQILEQCFVPGEIHGLKWNDLNGDGIQDAGEPVVSGIEVCLYTDDVFRGGEFLTDGQVPDIFGIPIAYAGIGGGFDPIECVVTDANGEYWFTNLLPLFYYVVETLPDNLVQTYPNTEECFVFGEVPTSDEFGSIAHCVDLVETPIQNDINFGNILAASLHGQKLIDNDGDGVGDEARAFVTIEACKVTPTNLECEFIFGEQNVFSTRTMSDDPVTPEDETGMFWLNVPPGDYRVQERAPFGTSQVVPANGEPYFVTVASGDVVENLDFVNQVVPPGTIQGSKFQDENGNGIKDAGETGIPGITFCLTPSNTCTQTNFSGDFTFFNVPAGQYSVTESLPFGSVNTTPLIVQADVVSGQTTVVPPFGNTAPVPANPEVTVGPLNTWNSGGLPSVYWQNNITVSKDTSFGFDHCGVGVSPDAVTLQLEFTETNETIPIILEQDATNSDVFTTVPALEPFFPRHGVLNLNFDVFCPDGTVEFQQGGSVYIDPSGQITDVCTDEPLAGAEVTLLKEFPPGSGLFVIAAESDYIQDTGSVQTTGADGRYGWDTVPGVYKVSVSAGGFITQESPEVPIPPPELELDLALERVDGCDVEPPVVTVPEDITVITEDPNGSTVDFVVTAVDAVDGDVIPDCDAVSGALFPLGTTTVTCSATDTAGNTSADSFFDIIVDLQVQVSLQEQKAEQLVILDALIDDASKKTAKELKKAAKSIEKSIDDKLWEDPNSIDDDKGHKVFDAEKKAVKSLLKIEKKDSSVDVSGVIDALVEVDRQLAQNIIDEASAFAGDKKVDKEIAKANKAMDKALEKLNDDKPDKAIDEYKKAWKHAQKAIDHVNDNDDDDDEEGDDDDDEENEEDDD